MRSIYAPSIDAPLITVEAADGMLIAINKEDADAMGTIKNILEDVNFGETIPLPSVNGATLLAIKEYIQNGKLDTDNLSDEDFIALLEGANYLDFEPLIYHLMPEWINQRPFPGTAHLNGYIDKAVYFLKDITHLHKIPINKGTRRQILNHIQYYGANNWAVLLAVRNGHLDAVNRLLQIDGVDPTVQNSLALQFAAQKGHLDVVNRLLQIEGVDPTANDNYAIIWAAHNGHFNVVSRLLQIEGVDPTARQNQAIQWAALNGHLDVVNCLLKVEGVDPAAGDNHAIQMAARYGHLDVVERLLQVEGVNPEVLRNFKEPTIQAIYNRHICNKKIRTK